MPSFVDRVLAKGSISRLPALSAYANQVVFNKDSVTLQMD